MRVPRGRRMRRETMRREDEGRGPLRLSLTAQARGGVVCVSWQLPAVQLAQSSGSSAGSVSLAKCGATGDLCWGNQGSPKGFSG